jgi:hypothetical protein
MSVAPSGGTKIGFQSGFGYTRLEQQAFIPIYSHTPLPTDRQILLRRLLFPIPAHIITLWPHYTMGGQIKNNFLGML